jgi:hypothetical protein
MISPIFPHHILQRWPSNIWPRRQLIHDHGRVTESPARMTHGKLKWEHMNTGRFMNRIWGWVNTY